MSADLVPTIGANEARERLARVRAHVEQAGTDLTALYQGRAWLALGHDSWESLCDAELGGVRIALPRAERRDAHLDMKAAGMSVRAIAAVTGVDPATVHRDTAGVADATPVLGRDGKTYPAKVTTTEKVERHIDLDTGEIVDIAERAGRAAADAADLPREPTMADAIREAKARPSVAAYKVVERWRLAALSANGIGGIDAVLADIDAGDLPAPDLAIWLRFIEESIAVAGEWATAIRRRNLRSVK